jgi:hypothetical protein
MLDAGSVFEIEAFFMRRAILVAFSLLLAAPALAQSESFTPSQRQAIVQIMRDALKSDPTILRDAIATLQADDEAHDAADMKQRLDAKRQALTGLAGDPMAGNSTIRAARIAAACCRRCMRW